MLKNYSKVTIRNLLNNKVYSLVNICGLALGIACCLLIFTYVNNEFSHDKFHSKIDRIYRVNSVYQFFSSKSTSPVTNVLEAKIFADEIPEIESFTRYAGASVSIQKGEEWLRYERGAIFSDPNTFDIFDYKVLSGSLERALSGLNNIVISEELAQKTFGRTDVAGQELVIKLFNDNSERYIIDAVVEDFPPNSSHNVSIYFSWLKYSASSTFNASWNSLNVTSILLLREKPEDLKQLESDLYRVRAKHAGEDGEWVLETLLQPFAHVHLDEVVELESPGLKTYSSSVTYSYVLGTIGVLILFLACINFSNLSIARSIPRAKEIGVRKVLGARKAQVAQQFFSETFIVTVVSFVLGIILSEFFLPTFNYLTSREFSSIIVGDFGLMVSGLVFIVLTAILSGSYPAYFVARFSILSSLSGKTKSFGKQYLAKGLVFIQFAIALVLVIGMVTMKSQINLMLNADLGYNDKNLAIVGLDFESRDHAQKISNELLRNPNIEEVSLSNDYIGRNMVTFKGESFYSEFIGIDSLFLTTMEINLKEGRNLRQPSDLFERQDDTLAAVIVTERFLKEANIVGDPLGLVVQNGNAENATDRYKIVGVANDYIKSTKLGALPIAFVAGRDRFYKINIRYRPGTEESIKDAVQSI